MRLLFAFSHRFVRSRGKIYSSGQFPYTAWKRYLKHFDHVDVVARTQPGNIEVDRNEYNRADGSRVNFHLVEERRRSLLDRLKRRRKFQAQLQDLLPSVDAVVARASSVAWQTARFCEKLGLPWAVEVVGVPWNAFWNYGSLAGKLYAPVAELQQKYWVKRAPFALYVTESTLQSRYPCPGITAGISNVMIPEASKRVIQQRISRIESLSCEKLKFGFVGSLKNKAKGLQWALKALAHARPEIPPFELRVIGPGNIDPWRELASRLDLEDNVQFDGLLKAGEPVLNWLDEIDVYLHPSLQDGLPRSLIEAMSRGCPALASRTGGIPELLVEKVTHEPSDWKRLCEQMCDFAFDKEWMLVNAKRNFITSKEYSRRKLSKKRSAFWAKFADYVASQ